MHLGRPLWYFSTCLLAALLVWLQGGVRVQARLVVAADGAGSLVRKLAGLRTFGWPYGQRGLVATVELEGGSRFRTALESSKRTLLGPSMRFDRHLHTV